MRNKKTENKPQTEPVIFQLLEQYGKQPDNESIRYKLYDHILNNDNRLLQKNASNQTPIMFAIASGLVPCIKLLVHQFQAIHPAVQTALGLENAIEYAVEHEMLAMVNILIHEIPFDMNLKKSIHLAIENKNTDLLGLLLLLEKRNSTASIFEALESAYNQRNETIINFLLAHDPRIIPEWILSLNKEQLEKEMIHTAIQKAPSFFITLSLYSKMITDDIHLIFENLIKRDTQFEHYKNQLYIFAQRHQAKNCLAILENKCPDFPHDQKEQRAFEKYIAIHKDLGMYKILSSLINSTRWDFITLYINSLLKNSLGHSDAGVLALMHHMLLRIIAEEDKLILSPTQVKIDLGILIKRLVDHKPEILFSRDLLLHAMKFNSPSILNLLEQHGPTHKYQLIASIDPNLLIKAFNERMNYCSFLLEFRVVHDDQWKLNAEKYSALIKLCVENNHLYFVELLLSQNPTKDQFAKNLINMAIDNNNIDMIQLLLSKIPSTCLGEFHKIIETRKSPEYLKTAQEVYIPFKEHMERYKLCMDSMNGKTTHDEAMLESLHVKFRTLTRIICKQPGNPLPLDNFLKSISKETADISLISREHLQKQNDHGIPLIQDLKVYLNHLYALYQWMQQTADHIRTRSWQKPTTATELLPILNTYEQGKSAFLTSIEQELNKITDNCNFHIIIEVYFAVLKLLDEFKKYERLSHVGTKTFLIKLRTEMDTHLFPMKPLFKAEIEDLSKKETETMVDEWFDIVPPPLKERTRKNQTDALTTDSEHSGKKAPPPLQERKKPVKAVDGFDDVQHDDQKTVDAASGNSVAPIKNVPALPERKRNPVPLSDSPETFFPAEQIIGAKKKKKLEDAVKYQDWMDETDRSADDSEGLNNLF